MADKKMGRPKLKSPRARHTVYLDQNVIDKINVKAERLGVSSSTWINSELKKLLKIK